MDAVFQTKSAVFNSRTAAVWIEDAHILLRRQADDNYWALPGGRVKIGEDSMTSLKRELKEELGADAEVDQLLWFTENFFEYKNAPFHEIGLYYSVTRKGSSILKHGPFFGLEGERLIYQWVPLEELSSLTVYPAFLQEGLLKMPASTEHLVLHT